MRELNHKITKIIQEEEKCRKKEQLARLHLMEVSKHFNIATEDDIKRAYHNAQALQMKLQEIRQQEIILKLRRVEIENQIVSIEH